MAKIAGVLVLVAGIVGCGNVEDGKGKDAGADAKGTTDATPIDAGIDAPMIDAPPGTVALTVKNYLSWCTVSVNGGATSTAAVQTVNVQPGGILPLIAKAAPGFIVAGQMWHHTTGDVGNGEPGTVTTQGGATQSAATVTVGANGACAWVCCPFPNGTGCENTIPDQCP